MYGKLDVSFGRARSGWVVDVVGGEVSDRNVSDGMLVEARTRILYLVVDTLGSGLDSNVRHVLHLLLRFVRSNVATGRRSDTKCADKPYRGS